MKRMTAFTIGAVLAISAIAATAQDTSNQPANQAWQGGPRLGLGIGPRNGTGPRAQMGLCPQADQGQATTVAPAAGQRGSAFGTGFRGGRAQGQLGGWGLRNGTGPRAQLGLCPLVDNTQAGAVAPAQGNRGPAFGAGFRGGRGQAQAVGRGWGGGPRNGTGPRAQAGLCPLVNPPSK